MENYEWFAVCLFEGKRVDLLAQSINIQEIIKAKLENHDSEITEGVYDCYCKWWENNNADKSIVFSTVFKTNLCRLDPHIVLSRLKVMEDTITFEDISNDTVRVWVGIHIDDYLYGLLGNTVFTQQDEEQAQ